MLPFSSSSFSDVYSANRVLRVLRLYGQDYALTQLYREYRYGFDGFLLEELHRRLIADFSPRLLIDGIWFAHSSFGGISRVWQNIFRMFCLPGILTSGSPVIYINRSASYRSDLPFHVFNLPYKNPLDCLDLNQASSQNSSISRSLSSHIFCSTWITTSGVNCPSCPEVALVHDCMPEHFTSHDPLLPSARARWINGSTASLSVSEDTSYDLNRFYSLSSLHLAWCHLAPDPFFFKKNISSVDKSFLQDMFSCVGISPLFVVLPGSGSVGSYKNPEVLAHALTHPSLHMLNLLITGLNADRVRDSICQLCPSLLPRTFSAGFNDLELATVFRSSVAVVIPSCIEGFGLPVIEAMASGGISVVSDVFGLREAGSEAALRFDPNDKSQLISILQMLLEPFSRQWISFKLASRVRQRLNRLNPDLFGLSLLAQCRLAYARSK